MPSTPRSCVRAFVRSCVRAFVRSASGSLTRTAWLLTGDADLATELVQEALVKTYLAWRRVRLDEATAYARRVLVNVNIDRWRRRPPMASDDLDRAVPSGAEQVIDDRDEVVRMLATLPPQQRRVIVLRYYNDLSEADVADHLGISVGAVKSAASRGTPGEVRWAEGAVAGGITYAMADQLDGLGVIIAMGEPQLKLEGLMWQDGDGKVWNDRGTRSPSAELKLGDRTFWFTHDRGLRVACSGEVRLDGTRGRQCGVLTGDLAESGGGGDGQGHWEDYLVVVLPDGAREPTTDFSDQCSAAMGPLDPGGQTAILLLCTGGSSDQTARFPSIHYLDATGKAVTHSP